MLRSGRPIDKLESIGLKWFGNVNVLQKLGENAIFMIPSTKKADSEIAEIRKNNEYFAILVFS